MTGSWKFSNRSSWPSTQQWLQKKFNYITDITKYNKKNIRNVSFMQARCTHIWQYIHMRTAGLEMKIIKIITSGLLWVIVIRKTLTMSQHRMEVDFASLVQAKQSHPSHWNSKLPTLFPNKGKRLCTILINLNSKVQHIMFHQEDVLLQHSRTRLLSKRWYVVRFDGSYFSFRDQNAVKFK